MMMMMMMIDWLLLAFESQLQPCVWTFTNLFFAAVCRSAAAPDPHAALMRTPHWSARCTDAHATLMCMPLRPIAYYHTHQTTPTKPQKLVRPKLDQPDRLLRPWWREQCRGGGGLRKNVFASDMTFSLNQNLAASVFSPTLATVQDTILVLFCVNTSRSKQGSNRQTFRLPYGSPLQWH